MLDAHQTEKHKQKQQEKGLSRCHLHDTKIIVSKRYEDHLAIEMLGALAQQHRIRIFRSLVKEGPSGLASSEIANAVGISPTSASFHPQGVGARRSPRRNAPRGRFNPLWVHVDAHAPASHLSDRGLLPRQPELCGSVVRGVKSLCTTVKGGPR